MNTPNDAVMTVAAVSAPASTSAAPAASASTVSTVVLAHPAADPAHPSHLDTVFGLIEKLFAVEAPILLQLVPSPKVKIGVVAAGAGIAAVDSVLGSLGLIHPAAAVPAQ